MVDNIPSSANTPIIRVAILENDKHDLDDLIEILNDAKDIQIIFSEIDAAAFIDEVVGRTDIDLALVDILLEGDQISGIEVIRQLQVAKNERPIPCMVFTKGETGNNIDFLVESVEAGATGFLRKKPPLRRDPDTNKLRRDPDYVIDFAQAIRTVAGGQTCFDKSWFQELIGKYRQHILGSINASTAPEFTRKQIEIMSVRTKYEMFSNAQVAYAIGLTHQAVRGHMVNIHRLLGVHDWKEAVEQWKLRKLKVFPLAPAIETRCQNILNDFHPER